MTIKEIVYQYLDNILEKSEISQKNSPYGTSYRARLNDETLFSTQIRMAGTRVKSHINFSNSEFNFIRNMFGLEIGDASDIIRDYLGDRIDTKLYDSPLHPYL